MLFVNIAEGYTGNLCTECDKAQGLGRAGVYDCAACPSPSANAGRITGIALAVLLGLVFLCWSNINSATEVKAQHSILIKIALSFLQLQSIAATFGVFFCLFFCCQ